MTEESKIEVPNFEATSDGKKRYLHRNNGSKDSGNTQKGNTKWTLPN